MNYLTAYQPTWTDRLANTMLGDDPSYVRKRFVEGLLGSRGMGPTGMGVVDATPIGGLLAAQAAAQDGDYRGAAMAVMPMGGVLNREAKALGREVQTGIRAYHGSPYDFDRFDMSKIGTGEGAQAYGHGLYFAEDPKIAEFYKNSVGKNYVLKETGEPVDWNNPEHIAAISTFVANGNKEQAIKANKAFPAYGVMSGDAVKILESGKQIPEVITQKPKMYEVSINAPPDHFLDWDKPLSEQSKQVRRAIADMRELGMKVPTDDSVTGADFYRTIANAQAAKNGLGFGPDGAKATNDLKFGGISGVKYLDQGSRRVGEGTRNYVVFDDSLVEILRKYGLIGMLGAGAGYGAMAPVDAQAAPR